MRTVNLRRPRRTIRINLLLLTAAAALLGCYGLACAAVGPLEVSSVASLLPPAWMVWVVMFMAILAGAETLLRGLSLILHAIAPHTATPLDDRAAVRVDELHDKLDAFIAAIKPIVTAPAPNAAGALSGTLAKVGMIVLFAGVTVAGGAVGLSCGSPAIQQVKADVGAGKQAVLDCEKTLAPAQLEAGLVQLMLDAATYVIPGLGGPNWDKLAELAIADVSEVKTCALAEYDAVAAARRAASPTALRLAAGPTEPSPLAAALAKVKAARGVSAIVTPGGTI